MPDTLKNSLVALGAQFEQLLPAVSAFHDGVKDLFGMPVPVSANGPPGSILMVGPDGPFWAGVDFAGKTDT